MEEGSKREGYWLQWYKDNGWETLNRAKTGSIGRLGKGKWNYESVKEEAKKYTTKGEFSQRNASAYQAALKNGWINEYKWFCNGVKMMTENKRKWSYNACYNEAKNYASRGEFKKNASGAYTVARANGWLDDYTWFSPSKTSKKWTYETVKEEASKYASRGDFKKRNGGAYRVARENGWLDDYTWFRTIKNKWNYETCKEEARKYTSRSEFKKGNASAYEVSLNNGWISDYDWFIPLIRRNYWNYETCKEEASKYQSKYKYQKGAKGAYNVARRNGWLDEFFPKK